MNVKYVRFREMRRTAMRNIFNRKWLEVKNSTREAEDSGGGDHHDDDEIKRRCDSPILTYSKSKKQFLSFMFIDVECNCPEELASINTYLATSHQQIF